MNKIILDLCGGTGAWSNPYEYAGYIVHNITLPSYDVMKYKVEGNNLIFIGEESLFCPGTNDLVIKIDSIAGVLAAPPCTMFSWARTNAVKPRDLREGMKTVLACLNIIWECQYRLKRDVQKKPQLKFWAIENPSAMLSWLLGRPTLIFNPYDFGDAWSKKTCLWGWFNEPQKKPVEYNGVKFDRLSMDQFTEMAGKSVGDDIHKDRLNRQTIRAVTPPGFAKAFFEANR